MTEPTPIQRILEHIGEPVAPPSPHPARSPPWVEIELDQSIPDAAAFGEPVLEYEFGQRISW